MILQEKELIERRALKRRINYKNLLQNKKSYLIQKRIFDIFFSVIALTFLLLIYPVIAILIKCTSKGPVLFRQKRVGFLGSTFYCYKFRTMVVNREAHSQQAIENDPRITRVGYFLRITNIDELPQFFNVLLGDMTIVGPRPHMHKDCYDFSKVVEDYKFRNFVKPGITGLAQVKGCRGPATTFEAIFKRYQWDSFYVRNFGFWLDMRIIKLTIIATFKSLLFFFKKQNKNENEVLYPVVLAENLN